MDPTTMHDTHDQEDDHQRHEDRNDAAITIGRRVLEEPGFFYAVSTLTKSRIRGQQVTAVVVQDILSEMETKGLGFLRKVKVKKTKPQHIFYKALPTRDISEKLKVYGVSSGYYQQQFSLPLSSSCKVSVELNMQHPQYAQIERMMYPPAVIMPEVPHPQYAQNEEMVSPLAKSVCSLYSVPPYQ